MPQQSGKTGIGSHKHRTSGHTPRTPGYKMQRTREANALADEEAAKKPKPKMFQSIADALKSRK